MAVTLQSILDKTPHTRQEYFDLMDHFIGGGISEIYMSGILVAIRSVGESPVLLAGFVDCLRSHALTFQADLDALDVCGTGGDRSATFNVSTIVALVLAGGGVPIAKHGNRAMSGKCGSADLWEGLRLPLPSSPSIAQTMLQKQNITFLFAPFFNPVLKSAASIRKELGIRTTFNLLGPLLNPGLVSRQMIGVSSPHLLCLYEETLPMIGVDNALLLTSDTGADELTITGENTLCWLVDGRSRRESLIAKTLGFTPYPDEAYRGGGLSENMEITLKVLKGLPGPERDIVLLNAAAAFRVAGRANSWEEGLSLARQSIDTGQAFGIYERLKEYCN